MKINLENLDKSSFFILKNEILNDYKLARISREISLLGRKEVLNGKAKFGIFGDGKEIPQLAMAKIFKAGDFRSGYYRDQTLMIAIGALKIRSFFAQLYAHTDETIEEASAGRMMTSHFGTRLLDINGNWKNLTKEKNSISDISCSAGNMPRLLGLAQASIIYKQNKNLAQTHKNFSYQGNEIAFGTIGNASTSEGVFWETINAACVLQVPIIISIWDDEYGISVPNKYQFSKKEFHSLLYGFVRNKSEKGLEVISVVGWDYIALVNAYYQAEQIARYEHVPVIIHVKELTQPQGHSTSGSHKRYKSQDRIEWENNYDCLNKFYQWILDFKFITKNEILRIADAQQLKLINDQAKQYVYQEQKVAWNTYIKTIKYLKKEAIILLNELYDSGSTCKLIKLELEKLTSNLDITKRSIFSSIRRCCFFLASENKKEKNKLLQWIKEKMKEEQKKYSAYLYSNSYQDLLKIKEILPIYHKPEKQVDGRIILRENFDLLLNNYSDLLILGEDVGNMGDVNQGLEGLQDKYGKFRIIDTGIREATIIGQGIGLAIRGLRPIVEIQYIDYILYALYTISDDLACLRYRTKNGQKAPLIIRTRGHRLEGIWHSGSPMGGLLHLLRGILILVPRNMTKAAGFYNILLEADEPALVIECLNGYRIKEKLPSNLSLLRTPIGKIEITKIGQDVTIITYGSTWRIVTDAIDLFIKLKIDVEIIDIQSLEPFDSNHETVKSLKKTHRLVIVDEDVPGGASAYLLQKILEEQQAYYYLDSLPITITAKAHRPAYGSDGDYFSKPSIEDIVEKVYGLMHEFNPIKYPELYLSNNI